MAFGAKNKRIPCCLFENSWVPSVFLLCFINVCCDWLTGVPSVVFLLPCLLVLSCLSCVVCALCVFAQFTFLACSCKSRYT